MSQKKEKLISDLIAADGGNNAELSGDSRKLIEDKCIRYANAIESFIRSMKITIPELQIDSTKTSSATGGPVVGSTLESEVHLNANNVKFE